MFVDLYLKAPDEGVARTAFPWLLGPDGGWLCSGPGIAVDVIGPLTLVPPVISLDGEVQTPAVIDPAFHLNVRLSGPGLVLADALAASGMAVTPANPRRVWAVPE